MKLAHTFHLQRRTLLGASLAGLTGLAAGKAQAQAWPARPLRCIVPFAPGGTTDVVTRLVVAEMSRALGQPIVVDNKPGAGTVIGVDAAAKAPADGLTLVTVANSFCVNQTLVKTLPYDAVRDLAPVGLMGQSEHVLATHPASGFKTVAELLAAARKAPGQVSYASFGNGTSAHIAGAMLAHLAGVELVHVPYKGQAPALNDLLGGQVGLLFGNWPELRHQVRAGKLVALGMATAQRSAFAPDIATLSEQGLPIASNSWNGLLTRAGTPEPVLARLNTELQRALQAPAVKQAFQDGGISSLAGTSAQFGAFIRSETEKYAQVIRRAGIRADS
jgi:tripartite-type tricarboxylate transporter receptor subunit TctC